MTRPAGLLTCLLSLTTLTRIFTLALADVVRNILWLANSLRAARMGRCCSSVTDVRRGFEWNLRKREKHS